MNCSALLHIQLPTAYLFISTRGGEEECRYVGGNVECKKESKRKMKKKKRRNRDERKITP